MSDVEKPKGDLAIRVMAMPKDTNQNGDIFGGWVLSHMDIAAVSCAIEASRSRVTTAAIESMIFLQPVHVGDFVSFYTTLEKTGRSSMCIRVETWAESIDYQQKVTEGTFTCVAIDEEKRPKQVFFHESV